MDSNDLYSDPASRSRDKKERRKRTNLNHLSQEEKRLRRMKAKRLYAERSRKSRKEYIQRLEEQCRNLEILALRKSVQELKLQLQKAQSDEKNKYMSSVGPISAGFAPYSSAVGTASVNDSQENIGDKLGSDSNTRDCAAVKSNSPALSVTSNSSQLPPRSPPYLASDDTKPDPTKPPTDLLCDVEISKFLLRQVDQVGMAADTAYYDLQSNMLSYDPYLTDAISIYM
eukprot:scpid87130/ scgid18396/ 